MIEMRGLSWVPHLFVHTGRFEECQSAKGMKAIDLLEFIACT